jgi:hypothetical protein
MSIEHISGDNQEPTWSSYTPHDIIHRQEIIDNDGESSQRAKDIDTYIDYINNMSDEYMIVTGLSWEDLFGPSSSDKLPEGFIIYKPDTSGSYKPYASIVSQSQFVGDKIIFDSGHVVVVNTKHNIGVVPVVSVKIFNTDEMAEYSTAKFINQGFETLLEVIETMEMGEHKVDLDIPVEW